MGQVNYIDFAIRVELNEQLSLFGNSHALNLNVAISREFAE